MTDPEDTARTILAELQDCVAEKDLDHLARLDRSCGGCARWNTRRPREEVPDRPIGAALDAAAQPARGPAPARQRPRIRTDRQVTHPSSFSNSPMSTATTS